MNPSRCGECSVTTRVFPHSPRSIRLRPALTQYDPAFPGTSCATRTLRSHPDIVALSCTHRTHPRELIGAPRTSRTGPCTHCPSHVPLSQVYWCVFSSICILLTLFNIILTDSSIRNRVSYLCSLISSPSPYLSAVKHNGPFLMYIL
jgi:hypothetical protein